MSKPREYTEEEIRNEFLAEVKNVVNYWANQPGDKYNTADGVAFSILGLLDGCGLMPGFVVAPSYTKEERDESIADGMDYYPVEPLDIAGELHSFWAQFNRKKINETI